MKNTNTSFHSSMTASDNQTPSTATHHEKDIIELRCGDILFRQGDDADGAYILTAGMLSVCLQHEDGTESEIDRLSPGTIVGEMALIGNNKRNATVYALSDSVVMPISHAPSAPAVAANDIEQSFDKRWQRIQLSRIFTNLLGDLDVATLHALQEEVEWVHLSNGQVVFQQDDEPDGMYVLVNGRLCVHITDVEGQEQQVSEIIPNETFGEFALLTNERRSATISAMRESSAIRITPATFAKLSQLNLQFVQRLMQIIIGRRQRTLAKPHLRHSTPYSITLLPATPGVDLIAFSRQLSQALSKHGDVTHLNAARFDELYGHEGASEIRQGDALHSSVVAWLNEFEIDKSYLLFTADAAPTAWTERCLNHADCILLVANPQADHHPGEAEKLLTEMGLRVRTELVLWHSPTTERPSQTAKWLDIRQLGMHHHIRQDDINHMARLARWLTKTSIALVLSGGGARGLAHLGVQRAFEELHIPIDYLGGTSMGALLGAAIITHANHAEMMGITRKIANAKTLFDRTLPITSLMSSRKVTKAVQQLFGDVYIEDQWIPYFCITTNLTKAQAMVMKRGPLWRAVRGSLSIPGVFAPIIENGEIIVDGGVMDNFPAQIIAQLCESDRIIGVNVTPFKERTSQYDYETHISGWHILLSRLNPFRKSLRTPSLVGTILRTLDINSRQRAKEVEVYTDLMLYPESRGIGLLDFQKFEEIINIGYETALEPLRQWKARRLQTIL